MAIVADYKHLSDRPIDLAMVAADTSGTASHTFQFNLSDTPVSGEGVLLSWNVRREGDPGKTSYKIFVNDTNAASHTVSERNWHSVQEFLSTNSIRRGNNTIKFEVTSIPGVVSIGDVILWYRKNI